VVLSSVGEIGVEEKEKREKVLRLWGWFGWMNVDDIQGQTAHLFILF